MKFDFHFGKVDLCSLQSKGFDYLVCPSDKLLSGSGGLDREIHHHAGKELENELAILRPIEDKKCVSTKGCGLGIKGIVHAAVPIAGESGEDRRDINPLVECYMNIIAELNEQEAESAVITLLGTGHAGWEYSESMRALWNAIMYSLNKDPFMRSLKKLTLSFPVKANSVIYDYAQKRSRIFFDLPDTYFLRGDPYLWLDLMWHFEDRKFNDMNMYDMLQEIQEYFHEQSGEYLTSHTKVYVKKYAKGGMSSGIVSSIWATYYFPIICGRFYEYGFLNDDYFGMLVNVEMAGRELKLPYDMLDYLKRLRA